MRTDGELGNVEEWSTDEVPEALRFEAWSEKMRALHLDWSLATSSDETYVARIQHRSAGKTRITDAQCSSFSGRRDPATDTADIVGIQLNLSGHMRCRHGDNQFTIGPGDLFVWASDGAGTFESVGEHRQLSFIVPAGPGAALLRRVARAEPGGRGRTGFGSGLRRRRPDPQHRP